MNRICSKEKLPKRKMSEKRIEYSKQKWSLKKVGSLKAIPLPNFHSNRQAITFKTEKNIQDNQKQNKEEIHQTNHHQSLNLKERQYGLEHPIKGSSMQSIEIQNSQEDIHIDESYASGLKLPNIEHTRRQNIYKWKGLEKKEVDFDDDWTLKYLQKSKQLSQMSLNIRLRNFQYF